MYKAEQKEEGTMSMIWNLYKAEKRKWLSVALLN